MRAEEGARGRVAAAAAAVAVTRSALLSDPTEREDFCAEKIRRWPTREEGGRQGGDVCQVYLHCNVRIHLPKIKFFSQDYASSNLILLIGVGIQLCRK